MYFNCPNHHPNYRKFKNMYIRRVAFQFQKEDFNSSKSGFAYTQTHFENFIDLIHENTFQFVIYYKILTVSYLISCMCILFILLKTHSFTKFYSIFPFIMFVMLAFLLIRAKKYYIRLIGTMIDKENSLLIRKDNKKWILGHSANFIQLTEVEDDKIPLNL